MLVRAASDADHSWIAQVSPARWGGTAIALRGALIDALALPALVAEQNERRCGLLTYQCGADAWEIVTLDALEQHCGVGTALVGAVADLARRDGVKHLVVVTTNDNLDALRFYQRRGFVLSAVRAGALAISRRLKPSIPLTGCYGIPIRDELELVRPL